LGACPAHRPSESYPKGNSRFGQKMQEMTDKVESGANFIANNEDKAQGFIGDVSRKLMHNLIIYIYNCLYYNNIYYDIYI
jgi:hypothetical protein